MNKNRGVKELFQRVPFGFEGTIREQNDFDPLGSYTGHTQDRDEIPVQDADDL